ncbi:MAG: class I SAM-dependent methyltransferase [Planctomycetaceae bacterium]
MAKTDGPEVAPFLGPCLAAANDGTFVSLVLSGGQGGDGVLRFDIRPIQLQGGLAWQWTAQRGRQAVHENLTVEQSIAQLRQWLGDRFRNAVLKTSAGDWEARWTKRGKLLLTQRAAERERASLEHDRAVQHILPEGTPCPFLTEIGVMTPAGQVRAAQRHKFRQINRYLEFVRDVLSELPADGPLQVVDCGCGKSGLTFALLHYLTTVCGRDVHLVGLDWNAEVLRTCTAIADRLQLEGIEFRAGDIASYDPPGPVQLVVSLHACDTATDAALARAIAWETRVVLAVPCCQHELSPQLQSPTFEALLSHGLLRERLAADVTDALRACLLEAAGYRTQVLEFIELEHTPKNLLLRAVQRRSDDTGAINTAWRRFQALKMSLGIQQFTLEQLLAPWFLQRLQRNAPPPLRSP